MLSTIQTYMQKIRKIISILMIVIFVDGIRVLFSADIFFCICNIFYNKHTVKIKHIVKNISTPKV